MGIIWSQLFPPAPVLTEKNLPSQAGKVYIVTGGASGVGLELSRILYHAGARVYIAGRSEAKARNAIDSIKESPSTSATDLRSGELHFLLLQLDDLSTIKATADTFKAKESRLDVLWNNAGTGAFPSAPPSAQNLEYHIATNCLGPFLLTRLLLPVLRNAPARGRVVWTSSMLVDAAAPPGGGLDLAELGQLPTDANQLYTASKVGNWFLAAEMARRYPVEGPLSVAQNPGNLKTGAWRHQSKLMVAVLAPLLYSARFGAYTELWAGLSPEVRETHNGALIVPWGRWHPNPRVDLVRALTPKEQGGEGRAEAFWDWCERETAKFE